MTNIGTSEPPKLAEYDVFLSFRGSDTREIFADCLYHDLISAGIRVFRDNEELYKGKEIATELPRAISNSRICIPIFSKHYATSAWCLREVAHMVECRQRGVEIMPIFYDVEVSDVKLRPGSTYEVNIEDHRARFEEQMILGWKNALKEVAKIKGWDVNSASGHGEMIKSIVGDILVKLNIKYRNLPREFVERQDQVESLMKLIDVDSKGVRFIIIYGMSGIGKTTLAKVAFNQLYSHYEGSSFLESVREEAESHGHTYLQQKLLSDILNHDFTKGFFDVNGGINNIRGRLCTKKVLIVIDDVDKDDQLKILAGQSGWFGSGSRIIVTTRDLQVLSMQGEVDNYYFHELEQMEFDDALCLFSRHAFGKDCPPDKYQDYLSKKIVKATGCLPLALEVIGSYLFNLCVNSFESNKIWEETLKELSVPNKKVEDMLMISINKLNIHQKQIFLDIACVFVNEDKTYAIYMWDDCGFYPFKNINILIQMSLIKITENNKLWMHDVLRDLGRQLIHKESLDNPGRYSRVWNEQEAKEIIKKKKGMKSIEILFLNCDECSLTHDALAKLEDMRFLKLRGKFKVPFRITLPKWRLRSKRHCKKFLQNLRWLCSEQIPSDFEGKNFCPSNLVVLELCRSSISEDWKGWEQLKMANKLKVLDLINCKRLKRTPDFSSFILLERLILEHCDALVEIDPSIGKLGKLTYLKMEGCYSLRELPQEIGSLTSLTIVIMKGLGRNFQLPNSVGNLTSLTSLKIANVPIAQLPESVGNLTNLNHLSLQMCSGLKKLPESLGNLTSLVELDISDSKDIIELPDSIGSLKSLKVINIDGTSLRRLPASLGLLKSLEELHAGMCFNLEGEILRSINNLSHLKELHLHMMPSEDSRMGCLPELPSSLNTLEIKASWMEVSPDLSYLSNLTDLTLHICGVQRTDLRWICKLSKLNKLSIAHSYVTVLGDDFASLVSLEHLHLSSPDLEWPLRLPSGLVTLSITNMSQTLANDGLSLAIAIPCLGELRKLHTLTLRSCQFSDLEGLHLLRKLRSLILDTYHRGFPDLSSLKNITHLRLIKCGGLVEIQGLGKLQSLEGLYIDNCNLLEVLYGLSNLTNLRSLIIFSCDKLRDVQGLEMLTSLGCLNIQNCRSLETLPDVSALFDHHQLSQLSIYCPKLPTVFRDKSLSF